MTTIRREEGDRTDGVAGAQEEIQAGVVAVNTSTTPHTVTFDDYSLKGNKGVGSRSPR